MKKQHLVWLVCALLVSVGFFLVWKQRDRPNVVRVGALLPMTGELGFAGEVERKSLELFDEQSPSIEIVYADSKGAPKDAIAAVRQMLDSGIRHFIVSLSYINESVAPVIAAEGGTVMALSMDERPDLAAQRNFRIYVSFQKELDMLADAAIASRATHVAVLYANVSTMKGAVENHLAKRLAKANIKLTSESFALGQQDFRPIIAKISEAQPNLVRILDFGDRLPVILQQIEETQSLRGVSIQSGLEALVSKPDAIPEGMRARFFFTAPPSILNGKPLLPEYDKKYGAPAHFDGVFAFDAATVMEKFLIPDSGKNASENQFWAAINPFEGRIGTYETSLARGLVPEISWATIGANAKIQTVSGNPIKGPTSAR